MPTIDRQPLSQVHIQGKPPPEVVAALAKIMRTAYRKLRCDWRVRLVYEDCAGCGMTQGECLCDLMPGGPG